MKKHTQHTDIIHNCISLMRKSNGSFCGLVTFIFYTMQITYGLHSNTPKYKVDVYECECICKQNTKEKTKFKCELPIFMMVLQLKVLCPSFVMAFFLQLAHFLSFVLDDMGTCGENQLKFTCYVTQCISYILFCCCAFFLFRSFILARFLFANYSWQ